MVLEPKIQLVFDRLWVVKKLQEQKNQFHDWDLYRRVGEHESTSPFNHYSGLMNYLLLTCFDILGQEEDWKDFGSWLRSKSKKVEREEVFERNTHLNFEDRIRRIHDDYNSIYSVRRSFDRFVTSQLSERNREKLFSSIDANKRIKDFIDLSGGTYQVLKAKAYPISNHDKLVFLFKIRNAFTHSGTAIGSGFEPDWGPNDPIFLTLKESEQTGDVVYRERLKNGDLISYIVYDWPNLLIGILEDYLNTLST